MDDLLEMKIDSIPNEYSPEQLDKDITRMQEKKSFRELMKSAAEERKTADWVNSLNSFLKL